MSMNIIIGAENSIGHLTGIGWYTRMLAERLPELCPDINLNFMFKHEIKHDLPNITAVSGEPDRVSIAKWWQRYGRPRVQIPFLSRAAFNRQKALQRKMLRPFSGFLYHGTNYAVPDFDGAKIATFHDMTVLTHPEFHPSIRVRRMTQNIEHAARTCRNLITISEFSRSEIIRLLGVKPERVFVTPLAARPGFHQRTAQETRATLETLRLAHGRYILFCGTIEPRKNVQTLLRAYLALPERARSNWPMVIVGDAGWNSTEIHHQIELAERSGTVMYMGYMDERPLRDLFSGAGVLVQPSITEGFGLPVVEAMSAGVPVLCSTGGSLPEVAGPLSACFDPEDESGLREKILAVCEDEALRTRMVEDGLQRAKFYSWDLCASKTLECYRASIASRAA